MGGGWREREGRRGREDRSGRIALGIILMLLGAAFLASQQFSVNLGEHGWPLFVIVPGLVLVIVGLAVPGEAGLGPAIPGGIITAVGLVLALQDATGAWASWAYAWALVAPGSVGVILTAYGLLHRRGDLLDAGLRTALVGLGLFVGFGLFFENVIGLDRGAGSNVLSMLFPIMAVAAGVLIVLANLIGGHGRGRVGDGE